MALPGIGLATALAFAREGAAVVIGDTDAAGSEKASLVTGHIMVIDGGLTARQSAAPKR